MELEMEAVPMDQLQENNITPATNTAYLLILKPEHTALVFLYNPPNRQKSIFPKGIHCIDQLKALVVRKLCRPNG